ncbi:polysaccharide biosynthesis protein [Corallincola holothuriorum]|uniref:Polysaccharide biosynthesis protein n=1 Tax=Corallincola holothuriorum TaxID=2282215 RepID=A0A368MZ85_9GAMM|nr:nucleoside-diphosphate sugar epimerase/dehydratase [Corallincola holothuriorum]RCU43306.1 polysaccharide biosynthesis protein [Corallincola holothuriorum]
MKFSESVFGLPRRYKRLVSLVIDTCFVAVAFWAAFFVRMSSFEPVFSTENWLILVMSLPFTLIVFIKSGLYRAILRYLSFHALFVIAMCTLASAIQLALVAFYLDTSFPRTVPIIYAAFLGILIGGARLVIRALVSRDVAKLQEPVIIYGAGGAGRQLCIALRYSHEYAAVSFIDDDKTLVGTVIQGLKVVEPDNLTRLVSKYKVKKVLLALPRASRKRRKEIINNIAPLSVEVLTVPNMPDIVSGKAKIDELRDVPIDDLLGREPVAPQRSLMSADITGKSVLVTGAGGSIGSELCKQIVLQKPKQLVLFELSEFGLYKIDRELSALAELEGIELDIIPLLGSVQRKNRLLTVMSAFGIQTVYHAAAYKHVPLVEYNVVEGVRNNVFGTLFAAEAAFECGVETFVLISTDKAVRPTNVMGTTKRLAELVLQALANRDSSTRFCMVRFGNVLGSSGSVIPLFKRQIASGGPITVTHPDIIRYFMTIPEAAQLVIQAGAMGKGGDVFVLDMGEPVKIVDLAKNLVNLSGLQVRDKETLEGDIEIKYTGLRPGEKLYEELLIGDNVSSTAHERIMTADEVYLWWDELEAVLAKLDRACHNFDHEAIRELLLKVPAGFEPTDGIGDLVWAAKNSQAKKVNGIHGGVGESPAA